MGAVPTELARGFHSAASSASELFAADAAVAGEALAAAADGALLAEGAHEPTPTPYFILEELLGGLGLSGDDHLLDVGCGAGRVLAYAVAAGLPCRVTGVELDGALADRARRWTRPWARLDVRKGSVLDLPLAPYTHFYLFNPFDSAVLLRFLEILESQVLQAITVVHMSDNGENYSYMGRRGWFLLDEGSFYEHRSAGGGRFAVFGCPQHYSIWRYDPAAADEVIAP